MCRKTKKPAAGGGAAGFSKELNNGSRGGVPLFRQAPLGRRSHLKYEALREEVHRFDEWKIPEAAPIASVQIAVQPCACCNGAVAHFPAFMIETGALSVLGMKPRTNSITLAEDISQGFRIDPGPANR
jgi:hypothetical protein